MGYSKEVITTVKEMRSRGLSVPEISRATGVSKTTTLRHIREVNILPKYYQRWLERRKSSKLRKERDLGLAFNEAKRLIKDISFKECAIIAAMLYWAEGSKKDFSFSNTNPGLIRVFLYALRRAFGIKNEEIKISIRIYEDLNIRECIKYWSSVTGIKLDHQTPINIIKGSKNGKLRYGMCRIRIRRGGLLHKKIFALTKVIDNYLASIVQRTERGRPKP